MKKLILCIVLLMMVWGIVVLSATVNGWFHKPLASQNTPQAFAESAQTEIEKRFTGDFALAMLSDGNVEFEKFHSVGKPVDRNTVFQVASLSKWISAVGVMKLVEDGKLDLDAPVSKYLKRWQFPKSEFNNNEVTARRLLSHTAGLTDGLGYSGFGEGIPLQSIEESLTKASDADAGVSGAVRVSIKPGSEFRYSGGGYTLLQLLVEEVSGKSFALYMKDAVFDPLKMTHSTYVWDEHSKFQLAGFYNSDRTKSKHYRYTALAATSLYTSLSDLELFFQAHLTGKNREPIGRNAIKPETLERMRKPHAQEMGLDIWGLGTILYAPTSGGDFIIGHDGKSTPPINTAIRLNPETGDGVIILETGNPALATKLASEWVFWKTGEVDIFLFPTLVNRMLWITAIGWLVIPAIAISINKRNRAKMYARKEIK